MQVRLYRLDSKEINSKLLEETRGIIVMLMPLASTVPGAITVVATKALREMAIVVRISVQKLGRVTSMLVVANSTRR